MPVHFTVCCFLVVLPISVLSHDSVCRFLAAALAAVAIAKELSPEVFRVTDELPFDPMLPIEPLYDREELRLELSLIAVRTLLLDPSRFGGLEFCSRSPVKRLIW